MSGHSKPMVVASDTGRAVTLTLSGAGGVASLGPKTIEALLTEIKAISGLRRVLILRGSEQGFCRGMDLEALSQWPDGQSTRILHESFQDLLKALAMHDAATVAVVEGDAFGGGVALASACDFVIANPRARFAMPELLWGLLPANAAPVIARRIGAAATRRLTLLTEPVTGELAYAQGLVDFLVEDDAKIDGLLRRLVLRADRLPDGIVPEVRQLFNRLQDDPFGYDAFALERMTRITDDPAFRRDVVERVRKMTGI